MTTQAIYRCQHCQTRYTYYPSGCPLPLTRLNDNRYCPDCKQFIEESLKSVPKRVERFSKPYDKITLEEVKEAIQQQKKKERWVRVAAPLFDIKNPDNHNITGFIKIEGHPEIFYSYWSDSEKRPEYRIEIDMERNLETGEEYPWEDIRNRY